VGVIENGKIEGDSGIPLHLNVDFFANLNVLEMWVSAHVPCSSLHSGYLPLTHVNCEPIETLHSIGQVPPTL
jgi:hypothetical protein